MIINATLQMGGGQSLYMGNGTKHYFGAVDLGGGGFATMGTGDFRAVTGVKVNGGSELSIGAGNVELGKNASTGRSIDLDGQRPLPDGGRHVQSLRQYQHAGRQRPGVRQDPPTISSMAT